MVFRLVLLLIPFHGLAFAQNVDWPHYLGGLDSRQYSDLDQIDRENVAALEVAWTYRSGDADPANRSQIQCNPLIVDGTLYATTPSLHVVALDAATGQERWRFNPFEDGYKLFGLGVNRGLNYWSDDGVARIFYSASSKLCVLDAATGAPVESFGASGSVDLRDGLSRDASRLFVVANSPGVVFEDLLILGMRVAEGHPAAPGDIRAYDVRTGEIRWTFHTIPHPGEFGYDTWPPDAWKSIGGANAWAGMSLDPERGIVYIPTGSPAYDFYGADRVGDNLFANCLLALDARTGERKWHFQFVHHDLWDRDIPAPPNLLTLQRDGKRVDAVAQITKSAHVFVFDRETGEPLFPIEEASIPPSELPGEVASRTQPLPQKPPPFSRQVFTEADVSDRTPEVHADILQQLRRLHSEGQFYPPSRLGTVILPGFDGGGEWGGAAHDPRSGILYVNASEMAWILRMFPLSSGAGARSSTATRLYAENCLSCHGIAREGDPLGEFPALINLSEKYTKDQIGQIISSGKGFMPSFGHLSRGAISVLAGFLLEPPAAIDAASGAEGDLSFVHTGYTRFLDKDGYPALKPPWGTLSAIDLNEGELLWQVPLGDRPEARAESDPPTGAENYGGPLVTSSELIFIAASSDEKFRAFDAASGEPLWETDLPAAGYATPATYLVDGRQYVVIAAGGGKVGTKSGDAWIAYALPEAVGSP